MIRRRLVIAVTTVVAVAIGAGSWLIVSSLEDRLVANVDEQFSNGAVNTDLRNQLPDQSSSDPWMERRRVAAVRYSADGEILAAVPSGTESDPDPLPDASWLDPRSGIRTVSSDDGPRYRAVSVPNPRGGGTTVVAVSLADVDETLSEARRIQLVVGAVAIVLVAITCWALIRRSFSPIDGMIATAGRIAEGDLTERTDVTEPDSEVGRLGNALDTMLDRIEAAVEEKTASEERMRRFVADASHDLRTPLTSVRGYAELYRKGATEPDEVAVGMARIEDEATRMSRLVDDLLILARLDQQRTPSLTTVDLGRIAGEATDAVRIMDGDRTYDLDVDADTWVAGDADQIRQVLDNLLGNARTHTPPGTTVDVAVRIVDGSVDVIVSDDGPGFGDEDRVRAFDRFWRATRADENPVAGSGLGLSIVRSIVESHGGTVTLDESTSGGARFAIRLPHSPGSRPGADR